VVRVRVIMTGNMALETENEGGFVCSMTQVFVNTWVKNGIKVKC
jgi:hypothetical protein